MGKKGFTLLEIVVALAISAILATAMISLLAPLYRTYQRVNARAEAQLIAGNVLDVLRRNAAKAVNVEAIPAGDGDVDAVQVGRGKYIVTDAGLVYRVTENGTDTDEPVFAPSYYRGMSLTMTAMQARENVARVTIYLAANGEQLASADTVLSPLRNIVAEYDGASGAGMYLKALDAIKKSGGGGAAAVFQRIKDSFTGSRFPDYDVDDILPTERFAQLAALARSAGEPDELLAAYYEKLSEETFYIATYVATAQDGTLNPIVYLTDTAGADRLETQTDAPAYLVYYRGIWYARTAKNVDQTDPGYHTLHSFDDHTGDEIYTMLRGENWTSVRTLA